MKHAQRTVWERLDAQDGVTGAPSRLLSQTWQRVAITTHVSLLRRTCRYYDARVAITTHVSLLRRTCRYYDARVAITTHVSLLRCTCQQPDTTRVDPKATSQSSDTHREDRLITNSLKQFCYFILFSFCFCSCCLCN